MLVPWNGNLYCKIMSLLYEMLWPCLNNCVHTLFHTGHGVSPTFILHIYPCNNWSEQSLVVMHPVVSVPLPSMALSITPTCLCGWPQHQITANLLCVFCVWNELWALIFEFEWNSAIKQINKKSGNLIKDTFGLPLKRCDKRTAHRFWAANR